MKGIPEEISDMIESLATHYCSDGETDKLTIKHCMLWDLSDACVQIDNIDVLAQVDRHINYCINEMKVIRSRI